MLAVTGAQRISVAPELPTIAEMGFPGFEVSGWYGILAPAATPTATLSRLSIAIEKVMKMPEVIDALAASGNIASFSGSSHFGTEFIRDAEKYRIEVARLGLKAE